MGEWKTKLYLDDVWRCDLPEEEGLGGETELSDILDRIPGAFNTLRRMKRGSDDYHFFARIGAPVVGNASKFVAHRAATRFLQYFPAYCGAFYGESEKAGEFVLNCATYMKKVCRPVNVAPSNHPVYLVTALFPWKKRGLSPVEFYVSIARDGEIKPLKQLVAQRHTFRSGGSVVRGEWGFSAILRDWAADHNRTLDEHLQSMAAFASCGIPDPRSILIRVSAPPGPDAVTFRIHRRAAPRVFADRDRRDHKGQRIFHYRRGHYRLVGEKEVFVRPCYAGVQGFEWNGYRVTICKPGEYREAHEFNVSGYDALDPATKGGGFVSAREMVDAIAPIHGAHR